MVNKTFHFMDGLQANEDSKRRMRRHVMMGKNAGKKVHRPSKRDLNVRPGPTPAISGRPTFADASIIQTGVIRDEGNDASEREWRCVAPNVIGRNVGNTLITLSVPVQLTAYSLNIVDQFFNYVADHIYPVQLGMSARDAKYLWLNILFSDESSYRCSLALMQACNEIFLGTGASSPRALYHLSQTFAEVKKRLEGKDALTDSSLAIVISLINQEQIRNEQQSARVHINGLKRMVELRGGLRKLGKENQALVLKICKTDILSCLQQGGPPAFYRDEMPQVRDTLGARNLIVPLSDTTATVRHANLSPDLKEILIDIIGVCSFFNTNLPNTTLDLSLFLETQVSICYRLLRFHELGTPWPASDSIQAAYHTALSLLMMSMFLQHDRRRVMDYSLITRCLWYVLDEVPLDEHEDELNLWLMVMGSIWIPGDDHMNRLAPKIQATAQRLGISTCDAMISSVSKFPWIHAIHDEPGQQAWKKVHRERQPLVASLSTQKR